jgi:hypothetical protein
VRGYTGSEVLIKFYSASCISSGAKQVAEKGRILVFWVERDLAGAKAHGYFCRVFGTTKEAAEKGIDLKEETEKHPSGAKAQLILQGLCTG